MSQGAARLVRELLGTRRYPAARAADAYELLGATQLDEYNDASAALGAWRAATDIRHEYAIPKRPLRAPAPALGGAREWTAHDELDAHVLDLDWLRTQALLVVVRVLGPAHKDTLFRLMYRYRRVDGPRRPRSVVVSREDETRCVLQGRGARGRAALRALCGAVDVGVGAAHP